MDASAAKSSYYGHERKRRVNRPDRREHSIVPLTASRNSVSMKGPKLRYIRMTFRYRHSKTTNSLSLRTKNKDTAAPENPPSLRDDKHRRGTNTPSLLKQKNMKFTHHDIKTRSWEIQTIISTLHRKSFEVLDDDLFIKMDRIIKVLVSEAHCFSQNTEHETIILNLTYSAPNTWISLS